MSRILIYAIPFGGGPAGKAALIADYLKRHHDVTVASYSHAVQLLKLSCEGLEVLDCQSRGHESMVSLLDSGVDVFVSIMDVKVAKQVKKAYPKTMVVLVDSLLSWRLREYPAAQLADFDAVDFHVCQYVPGVAANTLTAGLGTNASKLHIVAPLVQRKANNGSPPGDGGILIHFGGLDSPMSTAHLYKSFVDKVTELMIERHASRIKLLFAGGMEITNLLRTNFGDLLNVSFECLPYRRFLEAISNSSLVLTTPGLETAYESFFIGKPVLFLPPVNSTQLHQMEFFRAAGLPNVVSSTTWPRFGSIANGMEPYPIKTTLLCRLVNSLVCEEEFLEHLDSSVYCLLDSHTNRQNLVREQRLFWPPGLKDGLRLMETIIDGTNV